MANKNFLDYLLCQLFLNIHLAYCYMNHLRWFEIDRKSNMFKSTTGVFWFNKKDNIHNSETQESR